MSCTDTSERDLTLPPTPADPSARAELSRQMTPSNQPRAHEDPDLERTGLELVEEQGRRAVVGMLRVFGHEGETCGPERGVESPSGGTICAAGSKT
jgi:hypothetical protein